MKKPFLFLAIFISLFVVSNFVAAQVNINNPLNSDTLEQLLGKITTYLNTIIGVIATILLMIAGFYFLTSAGNPERIKKAKDFLLYAILGIVIVIIADIVVAVIKEVLGVST